MTACVHGSRGVCPWPGCTAGVAGHRIVVMRADELVYLERGFVVVAHAARLGWVVVDRAPVRRAEAACQ